MPNKALVAFGAVFGFALLGLAVQAWCSEMNAAPKTINKSISGSVAILPTLTLDDVLTRVLTQNPKLASFIQAARAREHEARQAGRYPNPELSVEVGNIGGSGEASGTDHAETTIRISQRLELGGKRKQRQDVGRLDHAVAERDANIARAEVLAEAKERFFTTLAAQKRLTLAGEQGALTAKVVTAVEERIAAGKTAEIERVRFQTLTSDVRLRQEQAARKLTAARQALAATWGSETIDFAAITGELDQLQNVPSWSELTAKLATSPEVARQNDIVRRAGQSWVLEQANRIPDLTFSLGAKNDQERGDNALLAELSIPLQLFNRNQGAIAASQARKAQAERQAKSVQLNVRVKLTEGWQQLHSAHDEVVVLRDEILPAAEKVFAAVTYGYQAGKFGFLEVLDAERTLFATKDRYVDALVTYHRAVTELEQLLGEKIFPESQQTKVSTLSVNKRGQS